MEQNDDNTGGSEPLPPYNIPVSTPKLDTLLGVLGLSPGQRVLDIGCSRGGLLVRAARRFGGSGVGVDVDADLIALARADGGVEGVPLARHGGPRNVVVFPIPVALLDLIARPPQHGETTLIR